MLFSKVFYPADISAMRNPRSRLMGTKVEVKKLPMMPIRDVVVFPYTVTPFVLGR
jgi:hypothetical protein